MRPASLGRPGERRRGAHTSPGRGEGDAASWVLGRVRSIGCRAQHQGVGQLGVAGVGGRRAHACHGVVPGGPRRPHGGRVISGRGEGTEWIRGSVAGVTLGASGEHITCHGVLGASQGWTQIESIPVEG